MSANQQILAAAGKAKAQEEFTTPGTYSFVVPSGVTSISIVTVGGGGVRFRSGYTQGVGGGGALSYVNNVTVTPGETLTVQCGMGAYYSFGMESAVTGTNSSVSRGVTVLCSASAANEDIGGSTGVGTVFSGGNANLMDSEPYGGGGGAAGYSGNGGNGGYMSGVYSTTATAGSGGGGGGGVEKAGGGGVGIYGQGANGAAGNSGLGASYGIGGSGGQSGRRNTDGAKGGEYGGGAGRPASNVYFSAGGGAVRIIWPGNLRQFPSTRTADE